MGEDNIRWSACVGRGVCVCVLWGDVRFAVFWWNTACSKILVLDSIISRQISW